MGEGLPEVILSQIRMSIDLNEMEVGMDSHDFFDDGKGDEMVASEQDRELFSREDFSQGFSDQIERRLFFTEREFKVPYIVNRKTGEILVEIGAIGFNSP
jgi:hypothetical protein